MVGSMETVMRFVEKLIVGAEGNDVDSSHEL